MKSYFEILNELMNTIETDATIPESERTEIVETVNSLFDLLWPYSD